MNNMHNLTVLVIEDNELNMKLVRSLLRIGGYTILEAFDAETGIDLARQQLPDLILMDIQLPGIGGLQATRILKRDSLLRQIPVIALTSYAMKGDEEQAREVGCVGYIVKPIDTRTFLKTIAQYLAFSSSEIAEKFSAAA